MVANPPDTVCIQGYNKSPHSSSLIFPLEPFGALPPIWLVNMLRPNNHITSYNLFSGLNPCLTLSLATPHDSSRPLRTWAGQGHMATYLELEPCRGFTTKEEFKATWENKKAPTESKQVVGTEPNDFVHGPPCKFTMDWLDPSGFLHLFSK